MQPQPYHSISSLKDVPALIGRLCYIIEDYGKTGVSVFVTVEKHPTEDERQQQITCFDFEGNRLDIKGSGALEKIAAEIIDTRLVPILELMAAIGLAKAQLYFASSESYPLVDVRVADPKVGEKFAGPGMVQELFQKVVPCQKVLKIIPLDEDFKKRGVIIKPSSFKVMERDGTSVPMYAKVE